MKRSICAAVLVLAGVVSSQASVSFRWYSATVGSSTYWANFPNEPATFANTPSQYTILTYLTADTTIDFVQGGPLQEHYGTGLGTDNFLGATNSTSTGKYTSATYVTIGAPGSGSGSYVGLYAYFVLVAMPFSSYQALGSPGALPLDGSLVYGVSGLSAALTQSDTGGTPLTPQNLTPGNIVADIALVPEPSTFALLGIGLGLVGLRRFRRK